MFKRLLEHFRFREKLPIELNEIIAFLIQQGCQDSIILHPERLDTRELRGTFQQYTTSPGVYAAPELVTLIIYPDSAQLASQRVICGKELIHVCDRRTARTNTPEAVDALIDNLLGPLSTDNYGLADLMGAVDRLALYQALALLFPIVARNQAVEALSSGSVTIEEIADWAVLPVPFVELVLSDQWGEIHAIIEDLT